MSNPEWTEPEEWGQDMVPVSRLVLKEVMERLKWYLGDDDAVIHLWDAINEKAR